MSFPQRSKGPGDLSKELKFQKFQQLCGMNTGYISEIVGACSLPDTNSILKSGYNPQSIYEGLFITD